MTAVRKKPAEEPAKEAIKRRIPFRQNSFACVPKAQHREHLIRQLV